MTEQAIDTKNESGFLLILLPIAILIIFLFATWPIILFLLLLSVGLNIWQQYQWQKWSQQVDPLFYHLLQLNQGAITPLDLAMKANFSAVTAKRYLDTKAKEFGAQCRNYDRQDAVYYFITASILGNILDDSEPVPQLGVVEATSNSEVQTSVEAAVLPDTVPVKETEDQVEAQEVSPVGLIQSELAKRLDVHSSTIYKRRDDPDFSAWTQTRDPEGISWSYSSATRLFYPLETETQS